MVNNKCDPLGAVKVMEMCSSSGPAMFGAMLGIVFAAQGMSQLANSIEVLSTTCVECAQVMDVIGRALGTEATVMTKKVGTTKNKENEDKDVEETYLAKVRD